MVIDPSVLEDIDTVLKFAALGLIVVGTIGYRFFMNEPWPLKLCAFLVIVAGVGIGVYSFQRAGSDAATEFDAVGNTPTAQNGDTLSKEFPQRNLTLGEALGQTKDENE